MKLFGYYYFCLCVSLCQVMNVLVKFHSFGFSFYFLYECYYLGFCAFQYHDYAADISKVSQRYFFNVWIDVFFHNCPLRSLRRMEHILYAWHSPLFVWQFTELNIGQPRLPSLCIFCHR